MNPQLGGENTCLLSWNVNYKAYLSFMSTTQPGNMQHTACPTNLPDHTVQLRIH